MTFRSATEHDVESICGLWSQAGLGGGEATDRAEAIERLREPDGFFVVAEDEGTIVAVAMGCYDNHRGWLKRVTVHPDRRGTGLGRSLVEEVERRFLAAGVSKLRLSVWHENTTALAFWNDLDYEELPTIRYFTKDLLAP